MQFDRLDMAARSELFDRFALKDQKSYYKYALKNHRTAATQINRIRALLALLTGLSAALAGLLVQASDDPSAFNPTMQFIVGALSILAVVLPALGGAFSTLADLYQWDKLISIYETALLNLEEADALSPSQEMETDTIYRASMRAFAEGTLQVMSDETAQWGQSIRTPRQLEEFIKDEQRRAQRTVDDVTGDVFKDRLERKDAPDDDETTA